MSMPICSMSGTSCEQVVALRRHGLDAVDGQEVLAFAGLQGQALGVVEALELAVVLVQAVVAGGEAAGREGQRQFAERENLGFDAGRPGLCAGCSTRVRVRFERRYPALEAVAGEGGQRFLVVDVEVRAGDEGAGRPPG